MIDLSSLTLLKGRKALVTGIANDQSIAWGCAKAFRAFGADLAVTALGPVTAIDGHKERQFDSPCQVPLAPPNLGIVAVGPALCSRDGIDFRL